VVVLVAIAFGYKKLELILILALFASPASVTSFTLAQQLDQDYNLAGQIVVTTTSVSLFTLFVWISVLLKLSLF
jgi:predicted permease